MLEMAERNSWTCPCCGYAGLEYPPYSDIEWELAIFEDKQVNAFAMPGGKIGVYTGILEVTENEHQLAAVIGH